MNLGTWVSNLNIGNWKLEFFIFFKLEAQVVNKDWCRDSHRGAGRPWWEKCGGTSPNGLPKKAQRSSGPEMLQSPWPESMLDISWYILIYLDIIIFDNDKNGKTLIMLIHADSCWSFHRDSVIAPEFLRCQAKARSRWTFCCPVQRLGWPYRAAAANTRITAEFPEFRDDARHTGVPGVSNRFKTFFFLMIFW